MRYKLKLEAVGEISKSIGSSIADSTFKSYAKVEGERLISLTNSRQVNSFIIRSLFNQWRNEVEKLESPYFDFAHEKVKAALKDFMNVLSNHISIDKVHLEPLLNQAIEDSILISFAPKAYLESILDRIERPQDFKRQFKYIKANRDFFKVLVDRIGDIDTKNSILNMYEDLDQAKLEAVDAEVFLNKLDAMDQISHLFEMIEEPKPKVKEKLEEEKVPDLPKPELVKEEVSEVPGNTINDRFDAPKKLTLAEKLQKSVNKSIEASLTLNEKFMFQNNLFGGDNGKMKEAFSKIGEVSDLQQALSIANNYNNGWDMESEEVEAFMSVLERTFA